MNSKTGNFDPISDLIGNITIVETPSNRFAARLIAVLGNELWFESKRGARWMQNRNDIQNICLGTQV
jgi:hypothetical protein